MVHILRRIKPKAKDFNQEEAIALVYSFIVNDFATKRCCRPSGFARPQTRCTCMLFLIEDEHEEIADALARYMVHWAGLFITSKWDLLGIWRCMSNFVSDEHCGRVLMLPL